MLINNVFFLHMVSEYAVLVVIFVNLSVLAPDKHLCEGNWEPPGVWYKMGGYINVLNQ